MNRPQPNEFGVSDAEVAKFDKFKNSYEEKAIAWCVLGGAVSGAVVGFADDGLFGAFYMALGFSVIGMYLVPAALLAASAAWRIVSFFSGRVRAYNEFKAALKPFEQWEAMRKLSELRTRQDFWRSLSGRAFEIELARLFTRQGYDVELTPASGDGGVDIILRRSGNTTIVQCKQAAKPVGPAVARELYGALTAWGAQDAVLASVSGVTNGVQEFIANKPIRILDLSGIIAMQRTLDLDMPALKT